MCLLAASRYIGPPSSLRVLLLLLLPLSLLLSLSHCWLGSEVLSWRAFYASRDEAWRMHYRALFKSGISDVLCCIGRPGLS